MKGMNSRRARVFFGLAAGLCALGLVSGQVIEYEVSGVKYQTLSRQGLTVIMTRMPNHVAGFALVQVSISNGSDRYWVIAPEDFAYVGAEGSTPGITAEQAVDALLEEGIERRRGEAGEFLRKFAVCDSAYADTNGYEKRREGSLIYGINTKLKAAATASAIALAQTRLAPGQSTDGSVFIPLTHDLKTLTGGRLVFKSSGETFEFNPD